MGQERPNYILNTLEVCIHHNKKFGPQGTWDPVEKFGTIPDRLRARLSSTYN
jgi:hypothetical protein